MDKRWYKKAVARKCRNCSNASAELTHKQVVRQIDWPESFERNGLRMYDFSSSVYTSRVFLQPVPSLGIKRLHRILQTTEEFTGIGSRSLNILEYV